MVPALEGLSSVEGIPVRCPQGGRAPGVVGVPRPPASRKPSSNPFSRFRCLGCNNFQGFGMLFAWHWISKKAHTLSYKGNLFHFYEAYITCID